MKMTTPGTCTTLRTATVHSLEESRYDEHWVAAYRQKQREQRSPGRDGAGGVGAQQNAREHVRAVGLRRAVRGSNEVIRRRWLWKYMVIYRTLANPAYLDLRIDQSNRRIGIFSPADPIIGNYGPLGLARTMTPRAWLSTWSGLSSQADLPDSIQHVTIPTLIVYGRRLRHLPSEQHELLEVRGG